MGKRIALVLARRAGRVGRRQRRRTMLAGVVGVLVAVVAGAGLPAGAAATWSAGCHPAGQAVYVANQSDNTVSVINNCDHVTATIGVAASPEAIAAGPEGAAAYTVTDSLTGKMSVIDTATDTVTATFDVGSVAADVVVSPDGSRAYVADVADNAVAVVDTSADAVIGTIGLPDARSGSRSARTAARCMSAIAHR